MPFFNYRKKKLSEVDLSDDYANAKYIADAKSFPGKWQAKATNFRNNKTLLSNVELDIRYGASEREKMDIFYPKIRTVGLFVFIHGGYWRAFDKSSWSHLSLGAMENGFASAIPSYRLCPEVSIAQITEDIARCITFLSKKVNEGPIVLAGHSAGGHLVSRMLCEGVLPKNVSDRLKRVTPISPLADLQPLIFTDLNSDLNLSLESAISESPIRYKPIAVNTRVWVGEHERPAFLHQAEILSEKWQCGLNIQPDAHHFDIIDQLLNPKSDMCKYLFQKV